MNGDGNGWAAGPDGTKRWGRFGAAGLVLCAGGESGPSVLLQHRAPWTAQGGTWAVPGGAIDSHETPTEAALRESVEETALDPRLVTVHATLVTAGPYDADPQRPELAGQWTYTSVIASTTTNAPIPTEPNEESVELRWVGFEEIFSYPLLPAFELAWPRIREISETWLR